MATRQMILNALRRFVTTKAGGASGSGVVITTNVVMTCFHCLKVDNGITVNGVEADIIAVDPKHDLILLSVPTAKFETVRLGDGDLGELVFSVCNPLDYAGTLMFGHICHITSVKLLTDMHGMPGISGSGLFNNKGELVGINHSVVGVKHIGNWMTCAVPSEQMHDVLAKVFNIVQPTSEEVQKYGVAREETQEG
jgi:S1-C subfamily serine protease